MTTSVFATTNQDIYRRYKGEFLVNRLVGGIPTDPKVAEGWIKKNLGADNQSLIHEMVASTMIERGLGEAEAVDEVVASNKLNGFKRDADGLYIEGRQLKAAIKEAANISWPKRRWGPTSKGTRSFWAEHVFVAEDRLHLGVEEPTGVHQRFVSTWRGTGIQYEEYVDDAVVNFTLLVDDETGTISDNDWAQLWTRGENQGIGASRSLSYGRYVVTAWANGKG